MLAILGLMSPRRDGESERQCEKKAKGKSTHAG